MNYKEKYLKYKNKYIHLKKQLGGSNEEDIVSILLNKYPKVKFDNKLEASYDNHKITYGEMDYDGLDNLIKHLNKTFTSFVDIGSGRGKLCIYILKNPSIIKSIGIEIVKERHNDAVALLDNFSDNVKQKVKFINEDFKNVDLTELKDTKPLIWISNLCFTEETTNNIYNKIINNMPIGTIICSSRSPTIKSEKLKDIGNKSIKMSWSENSNVYCYEIN